MEKFTTMNNHCLPIRIIILLASLLLLHHHIALAEDGKKIAILPFDVHAKANAANLQEAIYKGLSTEFAKSKSIQIIDRGTFAKVIEGKVIDEKLAVNIGRNAGANYVIMGSLSAFGDQISADAKVIDVKEGKVLHAAFAQGKGIESIGSISAQLRTNILI